METEVVAARWRMAVFDPGDDVRDAADDQDVESESVSAAARCSELSSTVLLVMAIG